VPYFKWQGVDLRGKNRRGTVFARSNDHLDEILFKRDIALINSYQTRQLILLPISFSQKINFYRRLATLLKAGVHVPQALSILAESIENVKFQEIINNLQELVQEGKSLQDALSKHPATFDHVVVHMINIGQEAGALHLALHILSSHLESKHQFYKKIRSAALLPGLTFLFFVTVALVIFIGIMPLFSSIFESMEQEIPTLTKKLMNLSQFLASSRAVIAGVGFALLLWVGYLVLGTSRRKKILDHIAIKTPGLKHIVDSTYSFSFFQSVAMLLQGGMPLVPALKIAKASINNDLYKVQLEELQQAVASGSSLSAALSMQAGTFSRPENIAVVEVGEESGNLSEMLFSIAHDHQERLEHQLQRYSTLFQPILMLILGVLIALLIVAVYMPIMSLSYVVA